MADCLDPFKVGCGCCGCGCLPCKCVPKKDEPVRDSRGACHPIHPDPDQILVHSCTVEEGGTTTVGAPQYELVVENPPSDTLFRNSEQSYTATCPFDELGNPVTVVTPAFSFLSTVSQQDADEQALNVARDSALSQLVCGPAAWATTQGSLWTTTEGEPWTIAVL